MAVRLAAGTYAGVYVTAKITLSTMSFSEEASEVESDTFGEELPDSPLDEATAFAIEQRQKQADDPELFQHSLLEPDEIRLLEILPDTSEPFFHFGFKIWKRKDAPPYSAISYVWGSDEPTCQIFLHDKIFRIRENLAACLSSVIKRKNLESELDFNGMPFEDHLWIDAICINQSQILERNEQVRCMDKIYAGAKSVLAWLGSAFEPGVGLLGSRDGSDFWIDNLNYLANRPYWSRMWVVQEFTLAKMVFIACGRHWIEVADFFCNIPHWNCPYAALAFERFGQAKAKLSLGELLSTYGYKQCTDPRDRIYALLGCMEDSERRSLEQYLPDYNLTYYETVVIAQAHMRHFQVIDSPTQNHLVRELDEEAAAKILTVSAILYQLIRDTNLFSEARRKRTQIQSQNVQRKARTSAVTVC